MDEIFEGLNERQKEAVECLEGPVLILAGAGSGKTKTLTHRIANLLARGVKPSNILAVTFTNKAAKEMRGRLWNLLQAHSRDGSQEPPRSFMPYMGTFHSICVKILRIEAEAAGLDRDFVIYDTDDQISLIKRIMKNLRLSEKKALKPKSIQSIISSEKNQGRGPEEYAAKALYPNQRDIAKVFEAYEKEKEKAGALDFDDLLLKTLELFSNNLAVREKWQKKFEHILIDEYQDTNAVQYHLVKLLVNEKRNICVVGDDWQSIYSWRGADFTNILNFERDFPGAKVVKLEQNYRSTGNILEASQKIINNNKTRTDKVLFTEAGKGAPVEIESLADEEKEAQFVVRTILRMQKEYPDYADFAVLYRTNAQSYAFEKAFMAGHVPYKIVGGVRFYDRKEVKDVLAILRLIVNGRDKVSFERVVKNVLSGIGEVSLNKLLMAMDAMNDANPLLNPDLPDVLNAVKARNGLVRLTRFLEEIRNATSVAYNRGENVVNPGEVVRKVVAYFDFQRLTDDGTPAAEERMRNLEVLASNAAEFASLDDFLADASLMSSADEVTGKNAVTLMTLHAAKGLEFPVVFVVGLEEGLFPGSRAYDNESDLEEERRLMYVGMTRAMRRLFLTYAMSRYSFGSRNYNMPSRFLTELGYNPYGSVGYRDEDGDGFKDYGDDVFNDDDFGESDLDPFPEDLPVWE
ncbi:UvrD-helicase domain-containing protein [Candidatus Saccharibacteria bacterium]|nr:UvrD-helicase domain-containing protein [Candidatus Saccharibacteria bacterium]